MTNVVLSTVMNRMSPLSVLSAIIVYFINFAKNENDLLIGIQAMVNHNILILILYV